MTINRRLFTPMSDAMRDARESRQRWARLLAVGLAVGVMALTLRTCDHGPDDVQTEALVASEVQELAHLQEAVRLAYEQGVSEGLELAQACLALKGLR
jgi:hypothetical protein